MGKPKAPPPPDPKATAQAQTGQNIGTAIANANLQMVDQVTPYGTLRYKERKPYIYNDPIDGGGTTSGVPVSSPPATKNNQYNYFPGVSNAGPGFRDGEGSAGGGYQIPLNTTGSTAGTSRQYEIPRFTAITTLPKKQQAALDAQFGINKVLSETGLDRSKFLRNYLGQGLDTSDLSGPRGADYVGDLRQSGNIADAGPLTRTYGTDFSKDRQRVEDALMARLQPYLDRDRNALDARLANQGITTGSEAYGRDIDELNRQSTDARLGAILSAGQEQSRLTGLERDRAMFENASQAQQFGQNLQGAAFGNAAAQTEWNARQANANLDNQLRSQMLQERFALRNQPINEIAALMSQSQVQNPGFRPATPGAMPTTDYAGIVQSNYANQLNAFNANNQNRQGLLGGILGLGSNLIMASDSRLKRNVSKVGEVDGLNVYEFEYVWGGGTRRGYMADEVAMVRPDAVVDFGPFMALDYSKLPEVTA